MASRKKHRPYLLSSSRPCNVKSLPLLSSRTTRATVRTYHTLKKQLSVALAKGDNVKAERLQIQMEDLGGIRKYQQASIQGQSAERGGDTSKVLMEWLRDFSNKSATEGGRTGKPTLLEIGALRTDNACSKSGIFDVERIDLNSQHPDIKEQDFMARAIPTAAELDYKGFDLVSLSLVLNFVGNPVERGEMLKRIGAFLRPPANGRAEMYPALFLVLPAPCVTNSRYLDEDRLESILKSLGYTKTKSKISAKLVYYLWRHERVAGTEPGSFKKKEVRTGKSRNNFAILLA